ncbi:protein of unknown function [Thermomonospora echinospora]|uniref:Uncharacterized protein n=1 Tax=Thermomonospora echinospora TaxID=1992 RepID=A0A1H6E2T2_9ACTN|nr:DUF4192 family protein [Thermomonospora echinospora]SEG91424.1 protein of unknown function [Thermomonospora echinospora]
MVKTPKLGITTPADAVAVIPYLLGFHPDNSLGVLCWNTHSNFAARLDLVGRQHYSDLLMQVLGMVSCRQASPSYTLAWLLQQCLDHAVPPKVIRERFSLTPDALAQAWGDSTETT